VTVPVRALRPRDQAKIVFAHVAYQFDAAYRRRQAGIRHVIATSVDELKAEAQDADVVVVSGLWRNEILDAAPRLGFVQSISAGTDQYDKERFRAAGVRLASAQGVNAQAVAEHAMAMLLAVTRQIHAARDAQARRYWRPMIGDPTRREEVIAGKTALIVGLGGIGQRVARFAKAFGMTVLATRRDTSRGAEGVDELHPQSALPELMGRADAVILTCPLTPETENLINAAAFARMKPSAYLVNVARGKVVDEAALVDALTAKRIAGAAIDVTQIEPLPETSPLWAMPNVLVTPHSGGETRAYEEDIVDLLLENIGRLERGETTLRNQIV